MVARPSRRKKEKEKMKKKKAISKVSELRLAQALN